MKVKNVKKSIADQIAEKLLRETGLTDEELGAMTELGETEMTQCCDTGRWGVTVWTGTPDEFRARKIANRIVRNVNKSPYGPIAKLKEVAV